MEALPVNEAGYLLEDGPPRAVDVIELYLQKDGLDFLKQLRSASKNASSCPSTSSFKRLRCSSTTTPLKSLSSVVAGTTNSFGSDSPGSATWGPRASSIGSRPEQADHVHARLAEGNVVHVNPC